MGVLYHSHTVGEPTPSERTTMAWVLELHLYTDAFNGCYLLYTTETIESHGNTEGVATTAKTRLGRGRKRKGWLLFYSPQLAASDQVAA